MTMAFACPDGGQRIAVFVKRTFALRPGQPMRRADEDRPLTESTVVEGPDRRFAVGRTLAETDLWESKPWTDVVVHGHARAPGGRPVERMTLGVRVGGREKWIHAIGDRRVVVRGGRRRFTRPEPFAVLPLTWRRAYGGIDLSVPHSPVENLGEFITLFSPEAHPGAYPRNPAGCGWLVRDVGLGALDLRLPNLETPTQLLHPEALVVGDVRRWPRAPIPAGFGWWRQSWFPRRTLLGLPHPPFEGPVEALAEVEGGWITAEGVVDPRLDVRAQSGASPGMRFARIAGGQPVELHGFAHDGPWIVWLPTTSPTITVEFGGRLDVQIRLSTVELLPDEQLANLVWVGLAAPRDRLPIAMPREGQPYCLLEGVDARVDGEAVEHDVFAPESSELRERAPS